MVTANATVYVTGPSARARVVISDGDYAGARFYLDPESPTWDVRDGDRVRVRFHPEDQFARRVIDPCGGGETAHVRAAGA